MTESNDERLAAEAIKEGAFDRALTLLRPLAERQSEYALLTLGWIYEAGLLGAPDTSAARSYYEGAAAQGSAAAYLHLGWLFWRQGNESSARGAFERGAQLGNHECKSELARLNDNADEYLAARALDEKKFDEAVRLLTPLAERDSKYALHSLGYIYETGAIGPRDDPAALSYYQRAAALGNSASHFNLGRLLLRKGNETEARAAFLAGAERGDLSSMSSLGKMMVYGRGGPIEIDAGIAWLEKAAANGHILAQRKLLLIHLGNSKSLFHKLYLRIKLARLAAKAAREMSNDPRWEDWLKSPRA